MLIKTLLVNTIIDANQAKSYQLFLGCGDGVIYVFDLKTKQLLKLFKGGHSESINSMAFTYQGQFLLSASDDKDITQWDIQTAQVVKTYPGHLRSVKCLAHHEKSPFFYSGSLDNSIRKWDIGFRMEAILTEMAEKARIEAEKAAALAKAKEEAAKKKGKKKGKKKK